jgi:hypothetical protein
MTIGAIALVGLIAVACGSEPYYKAGEPIGAKASVSIAGLMENPRAFAGETVLVQGTVTGVCKGSGCWALVEEGSSGAKIYAKSADHSVTVPTTCEGARIRVEGELVVVEPVAAQAEQECDHAHEHEHAEGEEPHVCPQPDCYVMLSAVELFEK